MDTQEFLSTLWDYYQESGLGTGENEDSIYLTAGDERDANTNIYVDEYGDIWVADYKSVIRVKTSINVQDVVDFRFNEEGADSIEPCFFAICKDYSGLMFWDKRIRYFEDGDYDHWRFAVDWFMEHPVD